MVCARRKHTKRQQATLVPRSEESPPNRSGRHHSSHQHSCSFHSRSTSQRTLTGKPYKENSPKAIVNSEPANGMIHSLHVGMNAQPQMSELWQPHDEPLSLASQGGQWPSPSPRSSNHFFLHLRIVSKKTHRDPCAVPMSSIREAMSRLVPKARTIATGLGVWRCPPGDVAKLVGCTSMVSTFSCPSHVCFGGKALCDTFGVSACVSLACRSICSRTSEGIG
ncbi:hypothetical protein BDZ85DRAFT_61752 [Elsinoe ampelina]|uniref:Uncharacterized protein n=1 Tax=Elsinoe ampelina TaxID=302913 RepID=A0A6A6FZY6_9PEZI|nr:hypothetical protein BDZ85DRAFT_61752 [Elsinoe ampelina]